MLLTLAQLVRLPNVFTAWADIGMAGIATGLVFERPSVFGCLLASTTFLYWAGMIWNDYFDLAIDRRERPNRPIPSGRIAKESALFLGVACIALGLGAAFAADSLNAGERKFSFPIATALVLAVLAYDGGLKNTSLGPISMGTCRFLNVLLGLTITGEAPHAWGLMAAFVVGLYIVGVTWFASGEAGRSDPRTLLSAGVVVAFALVGIVFVPGLAQLQSPATQPSAWFPYLLALFGVYLFFAYRQAIRQPSPMNVQSAIKRSILGLVVVDAVLASSLGGDIGFVLLVLLLPGAWIGRWVYST